MERVKTALTGVGLLVVLGVVGMQMLRLNAQRSVFAARLERLNSEVDALQADNAKIRSEIDYYATPENIIKEAKGLFNYKRPGETLMIIVPETKKINE